MTNGLNTGPEDSEAPAQSPPRQHDIPGTRERAPPPNADAAVSATGIEGLDFIMRGGLPTADYVCEYAMTAEGVVSSDRAGSKGNRAK